MILTADASRINPDFALQNPLRPSRHRPATGGGLDAVGFGQLCKVIPIMCLHSLVFGVSVDI